MQAEFSVIIPVYNEEETVTDLYGRLIPVMENLCKDLNRPPDSFEVLMVDDGSTDHSLQIIKEFHEKDKRIKALSFSRNFGHHIALTAGLDYAKGNTIIMMDGDLQDLPEEIPNLYRKYREGYDLVYGIREHRHDPIMKKITSYMFWRVLKNFSGVDIPPGQTMLRILSRRLADALKEMREHARFIHGMMAWVGFNATTMTVRHDPRLKGKSKYNITKMFRLAFHAVTSFSTVPLRFATYFGLFSSIISLLIGAYFILRKIFYGIPVLGYASIIVSIFFVGGIQLLIFGIFGEYLGRTYEAAQGRPLYIVKEYIS